MNNSMVFFLMDGSAVDFKIIPYTDKAMCWNKRDVLSEYLPLFYLYSINLECPQIHNYLKSYLKYKVLGSTVDHRSFWSFYAYYISSIT